MEERNGSDQVLKQCLWAPEGSGYVDELVQIAINHDPWNKDSPEDPSRRENQCERFFYVCQDANYNVLGVLTKEGRLIERYEYTPYGQRTIYSHGWLRADISGDGFVGQADLDDILSLWGQTVPASVADVNGDGFIGQGDLDVVLASWGKKLADDDPEVSMAVLETTGGEVDVVGLCDVGHQGLMHDKEFGLVYNRMRYLSPALGRFVQRDPAPGSQGPSRPTGGAGSAVSGQFIRAGEYTDGPNLYQYIRSNPVNRIDPDGIKSIELTSITMKRKHIKWNIVAGKGEGDGYGHHWTELRGVESYGWWPKWPVPGLWETLRGVTGELNGQTSFGGTPTLDPHHGDAADESFHPWRADDALFGGRKLKFGGKKGTACSCVTEDEIKDCVRAFAKDFAAKNTLWRYPSPPNCQSFQRGIMSACCMKKK